MIDGYLKNAKWAVSGIGFYAAFSVAFVRLYGNGLYADFAYLSNSLFPLLLIGSYQNHLISDSSVKHSSQFISLIKISAIYNIFLALIIVLIYSQLVSLAWHHSTLLFLSIYILLLRNPANGVLASSELNWMVAKYRNIYQIILVILIFLLVYLVDEIETSFILAIFGAGLFQLITLYRRALIILNNRNDISPRHLSKRRTGIDIGKIIFIAALSNSCVAISVALDKFAISIFNLKGADIDLFLLYQDVYLKAAVIYSIIATPFSFHFMNSLNGSIDYNVLLSRIILALAGVTGIGVIAMLMGVHLMPSIYGFELNSSNTMVPIMLSLWIALNGIGYIVLAICNAAGWNWLLLIQNFFAAVLGALYLIASHFLFASVGLRELLETIVLVQAIQIVTFIYIVSVKIRTYFPNQTKSENSA